MISLVWFDVALHCKTMTNPPAHQIRKLLVIYVVPNRCIFWKEVGLFLWPKRGLKNQRHEIKSRHALESRFETNKVLPRDGLCSNRGTCTELDGVQWDSFKGKLEWISAPRDSHIQGSAERLRPGFIYFVPAVAYNYCLSVPGAFMQPGQSLLPDPCNPFSCRRDNVTTANHWCV